MKYLSTISVVGKRLHQLLEVGNCNHEYRGKFLCPTHAEDTRANKYLLVLWVLFIFVASEATCFEDSAYEAT